MSGREGIDDFSFRMFSAFGMSGENSSPILHSAYFSAFRMGESGRISVLHVFCIPHEWGGFAGFQF